MLSVAWTWRKNNDMGRYANYKFQFHHVMMGSYWAIATNTKSPIVHPVPIPKLEILLTHPIVKSLHYGHVNW